MTNATLPRVFPDHATTPRGSHLVLIHRDARAFVVDLETQRLLPPFPVFWDIGGRRVAATEDGTLCVTGTYNKGGLAGYELPSGRLLWHRPDLKRVRHVSFDERHNVCLVERDQKRAVCVDPATGETSPTLLPGIRYFAASPYDDLWLLSGRDLRVVTALEQRLIFRIERKSFAVLCACFSPTALFVSEATDSLRGTVGPLRAVDLAAGRTMWELGEPRQHWQKLGYSEARDRLYGFRTGGGSYLDEIDVASGTIVNSTPTTELGAYGVFLRDATLALFFNGLVADTATLEPRFWIRDEDGLAALGEPAP